MDKTEKPKIILHNSISLDNSYTKFTPNMELHYQIVGGYKAEIYLIGSNTAKNGIEMFNQKIPIEEVTDFQKPNKEPALSYWVIADTKGLLKGILHVYRRYEFCRDIIVLVSKHTPKSYLNYLKERNYDHYIVGEEHVDFKKVFYLLSVKYKVTNILVDSGRILGNILLNQQLVDELSLLISPEIVGVSAEHLFKNINKTIKLKQIKCKVLSDNYVWLVYSVIKNGK